MPLILLLHLAYLPKVKLVQIHHYSVTNKMDYPKNFTSFSIFNCLAKDFSSSSLSPFPIMINSALLLLKNSLVDNAGLFALLVVLYE